ncbi:histone transcription regulator HIRA, WD repeat superfamily, partial [Aureobasidium melanogenum]
MRTTSLSSSSRDQPTRSPSSAIQPCPLSSIGFSSSSSNTLPISDRSSSSTLAFEPSAPIRLAYMRRYRWNSSRAPKVMAAATRFSRCATLTALSNPSYPSATSNVLTSLCRKYARPRSKDWVVVFRSSRGMIPADKFSAVAISVRQTYYDSSFNIQHRRERYWWPPASAIHNDGLCVEDEGVQQPATSWGPDVNRPVFTSSSPEIVVSAKQDRLEEDHRTVLTDPMSSEVHRYDWLARHWT